MSKPDYEVRLVKKENGWDVVTITKETFSFSADSEFEARELFQSIARQEMGYASGYIPRVWKI